MTGKKLTPATTMTGLLVILLLATAFAVGCSSGEAEPEEYSPEDLGLQSISVEAPDFTVDTLDGGSVTLSSFRGTPVLLNFWDIDCPPCVEEMPYLNEAAQQFDGQAVVMAIDIGDSPQSIQEFFDDVEEIEQISMTVPIDSNGEVAASYSVGFTPTTFLVDADGVVRYVKIGPFDNQAQVAASIELVLPEATT
ncbi:MAG: peroxiredoxin family protein [Chloroflexota bacterium]